MFNISDDLIRIEDKMLEHVYEFHELDIPSDLIESNVPTSLPMTTMSITDVATPASQFIPDDWLTLSVLVMLTALLVLCIAAFVFNIIMCHRLQRKTSRKRDTKCLSGSTTSAISEKPTTVGAIVDTYDWKVSSKSMHSLRTRSQILTRVDDWKASLLSVHSLRPIPRVHDWNPSLPSVHW